MKQAIRVRKGCFFLGLDGQGHLPTPLCEVEGCVEAHLTQVLDKFINSGHGIVIETLSFLKSLQNRNVPSGLETRMTGLYLDLWDFSMNTNCSMFFTSSRKAALLNSGIR